MMKNFHLSAGLLLALAGTSMSPSFAQQRNTSSYQNIADLEPSRINLDGASQPLSLADVVVLAFQENLDIRISALDQQIDEEAVQLESAIYDPLLSAGMQYSESELPTNSVARPTFGGEAGSGSSMEGDARSLNRSQPSRPDSENVFVTDETALSSEIRLSQLLPTGGNVYTAFESTRTDIDDSRQSDGVTVDPYNRQRLAIGINQPLLKNFGPKVTNLGINVAEGQEKISILLYQQEVLNRLADVMNAYWDLVFAVENLDVQRSSLSAAAELERVNRQRLEAGSAARADFLRAKADRANRQNDLINAKSSIIDAQDRLLQLLNWNGESRNRAWNFPIEPVDRPDRYNLNLVLEDDLAVTQAVMARPDYQASLEQVRIAELRKDVAKWQRLPELNALAEYGLNGGDRESSDAFNDVEGSTYPDWFVGAEFRYPLLNRRARAEYQQSVFNETRSERFLEQQELAIVTQVRAATRAVRTAQESIEASTAQVEAAEETQSAEEKRLDVGSSTTFSVLDSQENLAQARVNLLNAKIAYQKGLIELYRSQGTLVDRIGNELGVDIMYEVTTEDNYQAME